MSPEILKLLIPLLVLNFFMRLIQKVSDEECRDKFFVFMVVNLIHFVLIVIIISYLNKLMFDLFAYLLLLLTVMMSYVQMLYDEKTLSGLSKTQSLWLSTLVISGGYIALILAF